MKLAARTEYAAIALLELAAHYGSGEPVQVRRIADENGIPARFLVQILLQLKGAGLVASTRGAAGGYQLVKPPEEITLLDVVTVIEGPRDPLPASNAAPDSPSAQVLLGAWQRVAQRERAALEETTFADLVAERNAQTEDMYYI